MSSDSPFHEGERHVQERAGESVVAARTGRMIAAAVDPRAGAFLAGQRLVVAASRDVSGAPWASLVVGERGLAAVDEEGRRVTLDLSRALPISGDPLSGNLSPGVDIGLLAIDLATRRRLRINGSVISAGPARAEIRVREAYPNCPKYIRRRALVPARGSEVRDPTQAGNALDGPRLARLARADTAFVASGHPERGLDASHRGGDAGFIRAEGRTLRIPDYPGNSMFNTLGNLVASPLAGLTVVDFQERRALLMTGSARVFIESDRRHWELDVARWIDVPFPWESTLPPEAGM
jgi:predicted pyridoxine 5'-phosphate oxidase superfamily flavin-nucleotide-binding protein